MSAGPVINGAQHTWMHAALSIEPMLWCHNETKARGESFFIVRRFGRKGTGEVDEKTVDQLRQDLADELADVAIYLDIMAASEGIDLAAAIASKFNRTSIKVGSNPNCVPPFTVRPHAFTGNHPADKLQAARAVGYTEELRRTGRVA